MNYEHVLEEFGQAMYRPTTDDYRFSVAQLAEVSGKNKNTLRNQLAYNGIVANRQARVNLVGGGDVMKDAAYVIDPCAWTTLKYQLAAWFETAESDQGREEAGAVVKRPQHRAAIDEAIRAARKAGDDIHTQLTNLLRLRKALISEDEAPSASLPEFAGEDEQAL